MEVIIHNKSEIREGDILRVVKIHENRFDVASGRYVRTAILAAQQGVQRTATLICHEEDCNEPVYIGFCVKHGDH